MAKLFAIDATQLNMTNLIVTEKGERLAVNLTEMIGQKRIDKGLWWSKDCGIDLVTGCTPVSPACDHCWSAAATHIRASNPNPKVRARYQGLTSKAPGQAARFTGEVRPQWDFLDRIGAARTPQVYTFWADLFHPGVREEFIQAALSRLWLNLHHFYIICTKRPERAAAYFSKLFNKIPGLTFENRLMLMTTVESQVMADLRLPDLLATPGVRHGVSYEPALGAVDFRKYLAGNCHKCGHPHWNSGGVLGRHCCRCDADAHFPGLAWLIAGGETGPYRRSSDIAWFNSALSQAKAAGVPYFQKALEINNKISNNLNEWPSYIRVREVPLT